MTTASLLRLPVPLFRAFDEQASGLLREYMLICFGDESQPFTVDDVGRAQVATGAVSAALSTVATAGPSADVDLRDQAVDPGDFALLQAVLDHANRLARMGELLALPVLPEVAALRNWICGEVVAQAAGAPGTPWALPAGRLDEPGLPPASWPGLADLPPDEAWIVGDDANRIIGATPAASGLLGWDAADLVGERIVAVIPAGLREAHVAAFTRALVSGAYRLLDQPLDLEAHTRDGRDLPVTLTLSKRSAPGGRTVFLARLEPRAA